ncbi:DUF4957 domain-containing protein [Flavobacterium sp. KJJ]|uniref:DUF4957 domain-containing protein n=1 Tax=Flavobacterium sp. KJJ TaxID=1270193 RepID=UPI000493B501|nr:DUF4957 domain-containing protein [Flavobacterium sp. KJJ]
MKTKYIVKGLIATFLLAFAVSSCESYTDELLDGLGNTREFSPISLTAKVKNQTTVELNWTVNEAADHYVVEFSADDAEFKTIYKTVEVTAAQLPVSVALEGETVYSIRVKAITTGLADSKWSVITATTLSEQLFLPVQPIDIEAKQVTLRWTPNSNVTQITVAPGGIAHTITPAEKTAGVAVITGLTGETAYTATLLNGAKKRGTATFTTGIDIGTGILVKPTDDLNAAISAANAGAVLVLMPGDYTVFTGEYILTKPITIRGLRSYDKPLIHGKFTLNAGATSLSLIDLDINGDKTQTDAVKYNEVSAGYGALLISGCNIHDFAKSLISQSVTGSTKIASATIENSIVTNVLTTGGDFIDFRTSNLASLTLKNSTFNNCAVARDFIRIDNAAGLTGTGLTTNVLIDACTISNKGMTATNRILYVRFNANASIVRNTIFADTPGIYSNQNGTATATTPPTFTANNYFNSSLLYTVGAAAITVDKSTTYTTLNPQFTNAAAGDFTISNQALKDAKVGDPRWIK